MSQNKGHHPGEKSSSFASLIFETCCFSLLARIHRFLQLLCQAYLFWGLTPTNFFLMSSATSHIHLFFGLPFFFSLKKNFSCHNRCFTFSHFLYMLIPSHLLAFLHFRNTPNSSFLSYTVHSLLIFFFREHIIRSILISVVSPVDILNFQLNFLLHSILHFLHNFCRLCLSFFEIAVFQKAP